MSRDAGNRQEAQACHFLQGHGLRLVASNFQCRRGEIDLIMQDRVELVFIEVRHRRAGSLVDAASSVDQRKQQRLIAAARLWLSQNPAQADRALRFDVCASDGNGWQWIPNAFAAE